MDEDLKGYMEWITHAEVLDVDQEGQGAIFMFLDIHHGVATDVSILAHFENSRSKIQYDQSHCNVLHTHQGPTI